MTEIRLKGTKDQSPFVPPYGCCCNCYPDGYVFAGIEGDLQGGCGCACGGLPYDGMYLNADWIE